MFEGGKTKLKLIEENKTKHNILSELGTYCIGTLIGIQFNANANLALILFAVYLFFLYVDAKTHLSSNGK